MWTPDWGIQLNKLIQYCTYVVCISDVSAPTEAYWGLQRLTHEVC